LLAGCYTSQLKDKNLLYPGIYKTIFYITGCVFGAVAATKISSISKKVFYVLPTVIPIAGLVVGIIKKEKVSYIISDAIEIFNGAADAYRGFVSEQAVYTYNNFLISSLARVVTIGGFCLIIFIYQLQPQKY
jgi:hypothetical protein